MNECVAGKRWETGPGQDVGVEPLEAFFARTPRFAIAFSGGCDSSYLVAAALAAGCDVRAYLVRSVFQPPCEIEDAKRLATERGLDLAIIDADVLTEETVCSNPPDRCYWCKTFIFSTILDRMREDGFDVLADFRCTDGNGINMSAQQIRDSRRSAARIRHDIEFYTRFFLQV